MWIYRLLDVLKNIYINSYTTLLMSHAYSQRIWGRQPRGYVYPGYTLSPGVSPEYRHFQPRLLEVHVVLLLAGLG